MFYCLIYACIHVLNIVSMMFLLTNGWKCYVFKIVMNSKVSNRHFIALYMLVCTKHCIQKKFFFQKKSVFFPKKKSKFFFQKKSKFFFQKKVSFFPKKKKVFFQKKKSFFSKKKK